MTWLPLDYVWFMPIEYSIRILLLLFFFFNVATSHGRSLFYLAIGHVIYIDLKQHIISFWVFPLLQTWVVSSRLLTPKTTMSCSIRILMFYKLLRQLGTICCRHWPSKGVSKKWNSLNLRSALLSPPIKAN